MDRWVTQPKWATSPIWGPPPTCKQAQGEKVDCKHFIFGPNSKCLDTGWNTVLTGVLDIASQLIIYC